jgi:hypothetical protein
VERIVRPFQDFARKQSSGGILLIIATVVALVWANSPWSERYAALWHTKLTVGIGEFSISKDLTHWINDGLMAVFFLVVGLEIKREVLVGELEGTGFVGGIASALTNVAGGASALTAIVVIWGSGIASGIVDNIPFTATMIPVIQDLAKAEGLSDEEVRSLWWSLALGADFGGNLTLIGASANVVVAGMSERAGQKISFVRFMLYGIPVTLVSLVVATVYVLVRYY